MNDIVIFPVIWDFIKNGACTWIIIGISYSYSLCFAGTVRPPFGFPGYPEGMNGAGYPFPNPAAAAAAASLAGVHSTTIEHPSVSHSTPHSTPHSTLSESAIHMGKAESSEVH